MVAFGTLKAGDTLYDCRRVKMGNTTMSRTATWPVHVKEVDPERRRALVSWNSNPPKWYRERDIKRLRRTPPKSKG